MDDKGIDQLIGEVRAIIVQELARTIPPSIDPMRALHFDHAAERAVKRCVAVLNAS